MAIISYSQLPATRSFSVTEKNEHNYTLTWQVISDDPYESPSTVAASVGVSIGDSLGFAKCKQISSDCVSDDGLQWKVTASFGKVENQGSPLNDPPEIQWGFEQFQRIIDRDINGTAILNSADDPFQQPIEIDDSRPSLTISRNEANFNASLAFQYRDAVNSTGFFGTGPGMVKVSNISSSRQFDQQIGFYWKTTYEFHFNPQGWDKIILDQGFREKIQGRKKNILVAGVPIQEPTLLNGFGTQLAVGAQPRFKTFRVYPRLPFSVFNF